MAAAAAVILAAVSCAPAHLPKPQDPETTSSTETTNAKDTTSSTETTTEPTTEPEPTGGGVQPIGEYSVKNYIVVTGDSAMEMYSVAKKSLAGYAETANTLAEKAPSCRVYVLLAPTRIEFYGPEEYRTGSHSQKTGIELAYGNLSPSVQGVDAYSAIARHTDEYVYFRTDHHWTARGAYYAYRAFCEKAALSCAPLDSYESGRMENFVGSMYRYTKSEALKKHPDYVEYFLPRGETSGTFYSNAAMSDGKPLRIISTTIKSSSAKYLAFIQGDKPLIKMTSDCGSGRSILLIKESYGNALAPFLLENYSEVYALDPRQKSVQGMELAKFIADHNIQDVLFCNYMMAPSNSKFMTPLRAMLGIQ